MTRLLSSIIVLLAISAYQASGATMVEGIVFLKSGEVIECRGNDRIEIPAGAESVKILRNAYKADKTREVFRPEEVDSLLCWHPRAPEYIRKLLYHKDTGWMWEYFSTSCISVYVYSLKGYVMDTGGGIIPGPYARYFIQKAGSGELMQAGAAGGKNTKGFRKNVARCIEDDPGTAKLIMDSRGNRSKTMQILKFYRQGIYQ